MKRLLIITMLTSAAAIADDGTAGQAAEKAKFDHKKWPSLNEIWNETEAGDGIKKALVNSAVGLDLLVGYEYSDLDNNGTDSAHAMVTRTRLNYDSGEYKGFGAFVQAQYVGPINDHYSPEDQSYDVVADPEAFRFHQAYLSYAGYDSTVRFGAQEIILDNARFIGNVGWRLNAQSFNAASVANHSISNMALFYAYADSINSIDGKMHHERQYHMLNAEWAVCENSKVSTFAYLQRNDGTGLNKLDTYGLRSWGRYDAVRHEIMLALQRDAYYGSIFGEVDLDAVNVGAGIEYISGGNDMNDRFQTLNGTAHKFNGWADQFLGTGSGLEAGLIDCYGQVSAMVDNIKLMGVFHYFNTADKTVGGFDGEYGQEVDLLVTYPVCSDFDLTAKCAFYTKGENDVGNFTEDETAFWLRGTMHF